MGRRLSVYASCLFLAILVASIPAKAYWQPHGNLISTDGTSQWAFGAVPDGEGGIICLLNTTALYVQRMSAQGQRLWSDSGVYIGPTFYYSASIAPDGEGGVLIALGGPTLRLQHVDHQGHHLWGTEGVLLLSSSPNSPPGVVADGAGGAIVCWADDRYGTGDIFAQRVDALGVPLWTSNGVPICTAPQWQDAPQLIPDGSGGAVAAWLDVRSGSCDIYAQRVSADGECLWAQDGVVASTAAAVDRSSFTMAGDESGGAVLAWRERPQGLSSYDVDGQRFSPSGQRLWGAHGLTICNATDEQLEPRLALDAQGNALVAWRDFRNLPSALYCQRLTLGGVPAWQANGIMVPGSTEGSGLQLLPDEGEGAIVAWQKYIGGSAYQLTLQRMLCNGTNDWSENGTVVRPDAAYGSIAALIPCSGTGADLVWVEYTTGQWNRVYAQFIDLQGRIGRLAGEIHGVADVPGDQGGQVHLTWDASPLDVNQDAAMSHYTLWRAIDPGRAAGLLEHGATLAATPADAPAGCEQVLILRDGANFYWELVGTQQAYYLEGYALTIPTLFDSTAVCSDMHYFQVITHSTDPQTFWVSLPDSGYSVDNLAPATPRDLSGLADFEQDGLQLTWAENDEVDLAHYFVYRGPDPSFMPSDNNLVAVTEEASWFDAEWTVASQWYYKVSAADIHLNESGLALLDPGVVTDSPLPGAQVPVSLAQNHPNPFNPKTEIRLSVPPGAPATLRVYDAVGRLRRTLLSNSISSSAVTRVIWDGLDDAGAELPGGVYFGRLNAGGQVASLKMILLK